MQFRIYLQTVENEEIVSSEAASEQSGKHLIAKKTMRDFVGLENIDNTSKDAMIRFSYLSSTGNMDEAFKAIKAIKRLVSFILFMFSIRGESRAGPFGGI